MSFVSLKVECKARGQVSKDLDAKVGTKVGSLRPPLELIEIVGDPLKGPWSLVESKNCRDSLQFVA